MAFVFSLIGLTYGTWSSLARKDHLFIGVVGAFVVFLMAHGGAALWSSLWFLVAIGMLYVGYYATVRMPREPGPRRTLQQRIVGGLLLAALPIALTVLLGFGGASARQLDGFVLNLVLAPVGIAGGLVIAIPLAIGRASSLRAISWTCTAYIEVVRGAPLLGWLFVALFILDDLFRAT